MKNEEAVVRLLSENCLHISFAESCTAGMAVSRLADVSGASNVLSASFVTYSPEAKQKYAHVSAETLKEYGVVSTEVALEMARGCAAEAGAEVGVGITGVAGPSGGTDEIPVGTVCFGFVAKAEERAYTVYFKSPDRHSVRSDAVDFVFTVLRHMLETK